MVGTRVTSIVRSKHGLLTTLCYKFGEDKARYALEGSVAVTGSAIQWLRDQLGIITSAPQVEELAKSVSDNGGVYFVPAFSGLPKKRTSAFFFVFFKNILFRITLRI